MLVSLIQPGAVSATVTGSLQPYSRNTYVLRALAGQTMRVEITPTDGTANFFVHGVADGQPYKRLENEARFAAGSTSARVTGSLAAGGDADRYVLRALAGQTMFVQVSSTAVGAVSFFVHDQNDQFLGRATEPESLTLVLPASQDYTIFVSSPGAAPALNYTLQVTIP